MDCCGCFVSLPSVIPSDTEGVVLLDENESIGRSVLIVRSKETPELTVGVAVLVLVSVRVLLKLLLEATCSTLDGKG